jgi:hypothetical protein
MVNGKKKELWVRGLMARSWNALTYHLIKVLPSSDLKEFSVMSREESVFSES